MAPIFRPSTFNNLLKSLLQKQRYANSGFITFRKQLRFFETSLIEDLEQSVTNQTHVSTRIATHLLSKKYPRSNVVFSPLSIHAVLSLLAAGSKGRTLDQLLDFLNAKSTDELNSLSLELVSSILTDGSPMGGPRLSFTNGVWFEKNNGSLKPSFKKVVDTFIFEKNTGFFLAKVNLRIPKYKMSFGFEASNVLKELGLVLPFNYKEGMTEMVDTSVGESVYASSIYQQCIVKVNEVGTEAVAVTRSVGRVTSSMKKYDDMIDFVADHPFFYVIREDVTGVILFMGQVVDPRVG
ncbi:hypothetical protein SSX86_000041 [Deinandra increscens subsp. villosa]|uniref:Serpin domain-containing protein n=1 Tax=Deinandra increscens subsp. villosa TaxID=3103831 RepID=A0AAP0DVX2_9ASTR